MKLYYIIIVIEYMSGYDFHQIKYNKMCLAPWLVWFDIYEHSRQTNPNHNQHCEWKAIQEEVRRSAIGKVRANWRIRTENRKGSVAPGRQNTAQYFTLNTETRV